MSRLLLKSGIVVTQEARLGVLAEGDVLVEGNRIAAVGPALEADAETIDCTGHFVLPGLVNAHMHAWQTALRSVAANWTLLEYFRHVHAGLATVFQPEDIHIATLAGAVNQLDHGVTTLVDWCHNNPTPEHTDAAVAALKESGIRAAFFHGSPKPDPKPGEPHFSEIPHPRREVERLLAGPLADRDGLVTLGMAVLGPHYSTLEVSAHDFALAKELGVIASMHQGGGEARTPGGWEALMAKGLVGPHINIVHGNNLTDGQLSAFVALGVSFSVTPESEMMQGHGHPITGRLRALGAAPSLGVDLESAIGGDMFTVARMALAAQRALDNAAERARSGGIPPTSTVPVAEALDWITTRGAAMLRHGRSHRQPGAGQAGRHRRAVAGAARHVAGARSRRRRGDAGLGRARARRAGGRQLRQARRQARVPRHRRHPPSPRAVRRAHPGPARHGEREPANRAPRRGRQSAHNEEPAVTQPLLQTTVVGSYPQPDWLVNRDMLSKMVPRTRVRALWRVAEPFLEQAQDDATVLAIRDMERAGIDIVSDGEIRRESYSNRFATALEGIDDEHPGEIVNRVGQRTEVPRVVGRIRRSKPVERRDMRFLRANTERLAKITLPGPFTMGQQVKDEFYKDREAMCMDYAAAVNEEARDLVKAGADVIQLDEPWLRNDPEEAKLYAVKVINRALEGIAVPTVVHLCFGYAAVVRGGKPTGYAFLPQLARQRRPADLDRGGAAQARSRRAEGARAQEDHAGRDRPRRPGGRDGGHGRRAHPRGPRVRAARQAAARPRLRHEVPAARHRLRQAEGAGRRRRAGAHRARLRRRAGRAIAERRCCPCSSRAGVVRSGPGAPSMP